MATRLASWYINPGLCLHLPNTRKRRHRAQVINEGEVRDGGMRKEAGVSLRGTVDPGVAVLRFKVKIEYNYNHYYLYSFLKFIKYFYFA